MKALITCPKGIVFDTFFGGGVKEQIDMLGDVVWNDSEKQMPVDKIKELISDRDVYVTLWGSHRLDDELLSAAPNVKLLTHLCGTVVPFVSDEMWDRNVKVISGNDWFARSVAEGTVAYILSALRDIPLYSQRLKNEKKWKLKTDYNRGLLGRKVGIVSYGAIARYLVRILHVFGAEISVYDIAPLPEQDVKLYGLRRVSLNALFEENDIISVHTPLLPETHKLIGKDQLSRIKDGALFVNTSRGKVIDEQALIEELKDGRFSAFLDVYETEPPTPDSSLYTLPNVTMMPHMAGPTVDLRRIIALELMKESAAFIDSGAELKHEITRARAMQMSEK